MPWPLREGLRRRADHRYKGKALAGTALVHENELIHAAFFRLDAIDQPDRMASFRARRHK